MNRSIALILLLVLSGCSAAAGGGEATLLSVADQSVAVDETLVISLAVDNPEGLPLDWSYSAPSVDQIDRVATLAGTPSGAEFRWTPIASQTGTHEIVFAIDYGHGADEQATRITVTPAAAAAPVFLRPTAGGAHDLARDPCVRFDAEIRDDDSPAVSLRLVGQPPEGAALRSTGAKSATFEWCPTPDQVDAAQRWVFVLEADDGEHPAVTHEYIAVLQRPAKEGCPGDPPQIDIRQPGDGARVVSAGGYDVVVDVSDDVGLRDAPLLYWSTSTGDSVDLTAFQQLEFLAAGGQWHARVPPLGLSGADERPVRLVVVATDNDDAEGAGCDHTTQSPPRGFVALAGDDTAVLSACDVCFASEECASGMCVAAAGSAFCANPCAACPGNCEEATTRSGAVVDACVSACVDTADCADDADEPGAGLPDARPLDFADFGTICPDDVDVYRIPVTEDGEVVVTLDFRHDVGDLDLRLLDGAGVILSSSAGTSDQELVRACASAGSVLYAEVFGYGGARGEYTVAAEIDATACADAVDVCEPDSHEPNDVREEAAPITVGAFEGTQCGDEDYFRFDTAAGASIAITVEFDSEVADIDIELLDGSGAVVGASRGTSSTEEITLTSAGGRHTLRVSLFDGPGLPYAGRLALDGAAAGGRTGDPCATFAECAGAQICLDMPGGYCATTGCDLEPCADGAPCVEYGDMWICARDCALGEFLCRDGYQCAIEFDPTDDVVFACLP